MYRLKVQLVIVVLSFFCFSFSSSTVFFSPGGGAREQLVSLIQKSTEPIDIAIYSFTSKELGLALVSASQAGRPIRIIVDRSQLKSSGCVIPWVSEHISVRVLPPFSSRGIMHDKFMIIGQRCLTTGSYNWTNNAEFYNHENMLVLQDKELIRSYHEEFERMWKQAQPYERNYD